MTILHSLSKQSVYICCPRGISHFVNRAKTELLYKIVYFTNYMKIYTFRQEKNVAAIKIDNGQLWSIEF